MRNEGAILTGWYAGEVGGEALFTAQAATAPPDAARKWLALARVEAAVAARLATVMAERRIPIPDIENAAVRARQRCEATAGRSWPEVMQWLHRLAAAALEAVSYTHLDVYKRQPRGRASRVWRASICRPRAARAGAGAGDRHRSPPPPL